MPMADDFIAMAENLNARYPAPPVKDVFLPPYFVGGQPVEFEFMAIELENAAVGISYVLLSAGHQERYERLKKEDIIGRSPVAFARSFGCADPVDRMLALAGLNALCRHGMNLSGCRLDTVTDSMGLLDIRAGDRIGMVGFFEKLIPRVEQAGAELVIIELNERLIEQYPQYPITLDPSSLNACNKVLCTSVTVFNNTIDTILAHCAPDAFVSIVGPTAGYFPDPLFARGVDVVGGTCVRDGDLFMRLVSRGEKWGPATEKFCFQKKEYAGMPV